MRRCTASEPDDLEWRDWRNKCRVARDELERAVAMWEAGLGPRPTVDAELYGKQRLKIVEMFHRKCAYCETPIAVALHAGHLDHFRPKGSVRNRRGKKVRLKWGSSPLERPHPGYYWHAYDWTNLLPACAACNTRGRGFADTAQGKWDYFILTDETHYATTERDEQNERPLILNPWCADGDDPMKHLVFDPDTGIVGGVDEEGKVTVELLGLNRDGLLQHRKAAALEVKRTLKRYYDARNDKLLGELPEERTAGEAVMATIDATFDSYESGEAEYSAMKLTVLRVWRAKLEESA